MAILNSWPWPVDIIIFQHPLTFTQIIGYYPACLKLINFMTLSSIAAGVLTHVGSFPITNTMLGAVLTSVTLITIGILVKISIKDRPGTLQLLFELVYEYINDLVKSISDEHRAKMFLPWILSFFLFILVSNYWGLIPIFGEGIVVKAESHTAISEELQTEEVQTTEHTAIEEENSEIVTEEVVSHEVAKETETEAEKEVEIPLLRAATSDTNATFALAIVSFFLVIGYGIYFQNPLGLLLHYMQFDSLKGLKGTAMKIAMSPIFVFVGILELILEPLKSASLSFR